MSDSFEYKSLTDEELAYIFRGMEFRLKPMRHQYVSLAFGTSRRRSSFWHDVGTGKTLCALYLARLQGCTRTLVVCPHSAFSSWRRDLRDYTDFSYSFIIGSGRERKRQLKTVRDVSVITYEGLKTLYAKLIKGRGWVIQDDSFIHDFDNLVLDEDHRCGNYESLQSRICYELSRRANYCLGMTGTLTDGSFLELFNIYRVIDLGKSLGTNFFAYRFKYFDKVIHGRQYGRQWVEWELKPGAEREILDRLSNSTLCYEREECFELPPIQEVVRYIPPTKQFLNFQEDVVNSRPLKIPGSNILITKKIKAVAHVLRELPSGFFYYGEDKLTYRLKKNPKLLALIDILEDTSSKVLVSYWYREERTILEQGLKKAKISFCSAAGGMDSDDFDDEIERFSKDKSVKVLLAQTTVASEGFDAFVANVVVFFTPLGSPKMRKQVIGRIQRKGQQKRCLVIDLVLEGSSEERVIQDRGPRFNRVKSAMDFVRDFHKSSDSIEV